MYKSSECRFQELCQLFATSDEKVSVGNEETKDGRYRTAAASKTASAVATTASTTTTTTTTTITTTTAAAATIVWSIGMIKVHTKCDRPNECCLLLMTMTTVTTKTATGLQTNITAFLQR